MEHYRILWIHDFIDDPIELYCELDDQRWEVRKIEFFRDGRCGFANEQRETGGTGLGLVPMPQTHEIEEDPQFRIWKISKKEFEAAWERAGGY